MKPQLSFPKKQFGAALIVSLVVLIVMTIIGVTAIRTSSLEEKMAANTRDREIAFQATELALRSGEAWIASQIDEITPSDTGAGNIWIPDSMDPNDANATNWWEEVNVAWWNANGIQVDADIVFGTDGDDITITKPRYVIEYQQFVTDDLSVGTGSTLSGRHFYRITARGTGGSEQSRILLQSTSSRRY